MKATPDFRTVRQLVELHKNSMLRANPEYQRGIVWNEIQQKKLIDSILRGYPIPLIYLHHIRRDVAGMQRDDLEIIDGQQRIHSLCRYVDGGFKLLDPVIDDRRAKFPKFIKDQVCPWAARDFQTLTEDLQGGLLDTRLAVAFIETENANEVRDLFVRLQSGEPLNAQETRDAWPGDFTEFVLRLGGKPEVHRYPGHEFFTRVLRMRPGTDRGKTRQLAAQISMLYLTRRWHGEGHFTDINARAINEFYYENLAFDQNCDEAKRLCRVLDVLSDSLQAAKHPKLHGHDAIHLVLFADSLMDDYTPIWQSKLPQALDKFIANFSAAKAKKEYTNDYWLKYGMWTSTSSDKAASISMRHKFYVDQMLSSMGPLPKKDPTRLFGEAERATLFYRQNKKCAVCDADMKWEDVEVHHVEEHSSGGKTTLENGAAVHKVCHPKGAAATKAFAEKFKANSTQP